jgi:hypothetical protein
VQFTFEGLTPKSIRNIFLPWILHISKITVIGKDNLIGLRKRFFTSMSSALYFPAFDPKIDQEHIRPMGKLYVLYIDSR